MSDTTSDLRILWDYLILNQTPHPADAIFAFGSNALRVAEYASTLFLKGYGKYLIVSGGNGKDSLFKKPEAEIFAEIAEKQGVPRDKILVEKISSNTGENILFTQELLREKHLTLTSFLLVNKPYMERRTYATFRRQWPTAECIVTSPPISFDEYMSSTNKDWINVMIGSIKRLREYPEKGFQIYQEIPTKVWEAYLRLDMQT